MNTKFEIHSSLMIDNQMLQKLKRLYKKASDAKKNAYSPYSQFNVGAAILLTDGKIITGCNIENASYGLTICAERTAIFSTISKGYRKDDIVAIAVAASSNNFSPCGACRQVISEFGKDIIIMFEFDEKILIQPITSLLAYSFQL